MKFKFRFLSVANLCLSMKKYVLFSVLLSSKKRLNFMEHFVTTMPNDQEKIKLKVTIEFLFETNGKKITISEAV